METERGSVRHARTGPDLDPPTLITQLKLLQVAQGLVRILVDWAVLSFPS